MGIFNDFGGAWVLNFFDQTFNAADSWVQTLGFEPSKTRLNKKIFFSLFHPEDLEYVQKTIEQKTLNKAQYHIFKYRLRHLDGQYKWIKSRWKFKYDNNNLFKVVGFDEDIDDILKIERAKRNYKEIFDGVDVGIVLLDRRNGNFLDANEAALKMFGYDKNEFITLSISALCPYENCNHRASNCFIKEHKERNRSNFKGHVKRKNGELFWAEISFKSSIIDDSKKVLVTFQDRTEQKKAKELLEISKKELADKEAFFHALINNAPIPIFYKNIAGEFLGCNPKFEEDFGFDGSKIMGKNVYEIVPAEFAKEYAGADSKLFEEPYRLQAYESRIKNPVTGQAKDVVFYKSIFFDALGNPAGIVGAALDISEQKRMQKAVLKSEQKFRAILDHAIDAIVVIDVLSNKFAYANKAMIQMLGFEEDEFYDLQLADIIDKRDIKSATQIFMSRLGGENVFIDKIRLIAKNETLVVTESSSSVYRQDGKYYIIGFFKDITENTQNEKKLEIYEKIVSSSKDRLSFLDQNRCFLAVNATYSEDLGLEESQILGKTPAQLFGEDVYREKIKPKLDRAYNGEAVIFSDWFESNGKNNFFQVTYVPYFGENNHIEGVVINAHNITGRKNIEEKLKILNQTLEMKVKEKIEELRHKDQLMLNQSRFAAMGEMLSMIAHQWRQPLNAVNASVINLKMLTELGEISDEEIYKQCDFVERQAQRMSQTISDFMNFFKPNKEMDEFIVLNSLNRAKEMILPQLTSRGIGLSVDGDEDLMVFGVENEFEHVILNLLTNARDAIDEKNPTEKEIKIKLVAEGKDILVKISDTAGGIDEEIMDKIFDPYFTTTADSKGTGIGLYMAKMIVQRHFNGSLWVKNIEGGAQFTVSLPRGIFGIDVQKSEESKSQDPKQDLQQELKQNLKQNLKQESKS